MLNNKVFLIWPETDKGYYDLNPLGQIFGQKGIFFPLPLLYVASALGDFWDYTLVDENIHKINQKQAEQADFFLISSNILQRGSVEKLVKRLEPLKKPIIIGGPVLSTVEEAFNNKYVIKVHGEIESIEKERASQLLSVADALSNDMQSNNLQSNYYAINHPEIKKIKIPRYDLVKPGEYCYLSIQTSRGCPHICDFCQEPFLYGTHQRKEPTQVIQELNALFKLGKRLTTFIVDDNFIGNLKNERNKNELLIMLKEIYVWQEEHNFPFDFITQCSLDIADHEDVVELMAKIGLNIVYLGIETTDSSTLASMHKKQNMNHDMLSTIEMFRNFGIGVMGGLIIGFDEDTSDSISKQYDFIRKSCIPYAGISLLQAPPGSKLFGKLQQEGRISKDNNSLTKSFRTNIITKMPPEELYNNYLKLSMMLYNPNEYFSRSLKWSELWNDKHLIPGLKGSISANILLTRIFKSFIIQGVFSKYRLSFWKYMVSAIWKFKSNPNKLSLYLFLSYFYTIIHDIITRLQRNIEVLKAETKDEWMNHHNKILP